MKLVLQGVTISVSNLEQSKRFYEQVLGFEPDDYYEPTRWQSYHTEGRAYLAICEVANYRKVASKDIVNFDVDSIEEYWASIGAHVDVEAALGETPWGSHRFVIRDPDGNRLGFVQKRNK